MILAIDIGNTTLEIALMNNYEVYKKHFINSKSKYLLNDLEIINKNFSENTIKTVVISSVVPAHSEIVVNFFKNQNKQVYLITDKLNIMVKLPRGGIGVDIICKSAWLAGGLKQEGLVLDIGTATVLNYVNKEQNLVSAAISIGLNTIYQALHDNTALLPLLKPVIVSKVLGNNTKEAMEGGIFFSYIGMLNNLIKKAILETSTNNVFLTGGLASLIKNEVDFKYTYDQNLIFKGIYLIYKNNDFTQQ